MSIAPSISVSSPGLFPGPALGAASEIPLSDLRRFSVEEYHGLIDAGFFAEEERYELLRGLLVHKMGKKRAHSYVTQMLREIIARMLVGYFVDAQEPITTSDSEPEPDVSVVRGRREDYKQRPPGGKDTPLVVEVSESTLARDRGIKREIYAEASIPVYWIVNLIDRQIEVHTLPSESATPVADYAPAVIYGANDEVPVVIDGIEMGRITVKDILP